MNLRDRFLFLLTTRALGALTRVHLAVHRLTGGRVGGSTLGTPVLFLTTTGRKSGQPRTIPLNYFRAGDAFVVIASNAGQAAHPAWYLNLLADPRATIQVGRARRRVVARAADAEEKRRLWPRVVQMSRLYDAYRRRTPRDIPVVLLRPEPQ